MIADLNISVRVKVCPIIREKDGLAMSSRNQYLSIKNRKEAAILYQALSKTRQLILKGEHRVAVIKKDLKSIITKYSSSRIDYIACVDAETLQPIKKLKGKVLIALAAYFGRTRLIDNITLKIK